LPAIANAANKTWKLQLCPHASRRDRTDQSTPRSSTKLKGITVTRHPALRRQTSNPFRQTVDNHVSGSLRYHFLPENGME